MYADIGNDYPIAHGYVLTIGIHYIPVRRLSGSVEPG